MNFQLGHEWLRELEREIEQAAAERQREADHKLDAAVYGSAVRVRLPDDFKVSTHG